MMIRDESRHFFVMNLIVNRGKCVILVLGIFGLCEDINKRGYG